MKTKLKVLTMLACSALGSTACSERVNAMTEAEGNPVEVSAINPTSDFSIQYTTDVPVAFFRSAQHQGKVEKVEYESKDYTGPMTTTHKPAYVYVPYGYDPMQKYDIIYLMHGWGGNAEGYFAGRFGEQMKNLFDNLIEQGLSKPFIAVSPTWDKDNRGKGWGESCEEASVFFNEYKNDLIPAIEGKYSTYAESTDIEGIIASREDIRAALPVTLGAQNWQAHKAMVPAEGLKALSLK